ncbi:unnamed protein product [Prorocentrum cordatum]|uniref:Uncharacterized protein n=1 Tax=Prorocentrum cordatum TaxID=2364126 RepID=A0ABN9TKN8_9DINO|nr:unnamed protein product [Polarella glacialis]
MAEGVGCCACAEQPTHSPGSSAAAQAQCGEQAWAPSSHRTGSDRARDEWGTCEWTSPMPALEAATEQGIRGHWQRALWSPTEPLEARWDSTPTKYAYSSPCKKGQQRKVLCAHCR